MKGRVPVFSAITRRPHESPRRSETRSPAARAAPVGSEIARRRRWRRIISAAVCASLVAGNSAARSASTSRHYSGPMSQRGNSIRFSITGRLIGRLSYTANFHCSDGVNVYSFPTTLNPFEIGARGRFSTDQTPAGRHDDHVRLRGRLSGARAQGTLAEEYISIIGSHCRSGKLRFSAHRSR